MSPDSWLEKKYGSEFFSGNFDHLNETISKLGLKSFPKIITVAGTNGKGETSRLIYELLLKNKKSASLWSSPHLFSVCERFSFDGENILDDLLINRFEKVETILKEIDYKFSYFEFLFLCFLYESRERKIDYLVLEVGLGGRLDAVNCLDADFVALTSISRDHQSILGNRYSQILKEKLGVLRDGVKLYSSLELKYLQNQTKKFISDKNIKWVDLFQNQMTNREATFSQRNEKLAGALFSDLLGQKQQIKSNFSKKYELKYLDTSIDFYSSHNPDGLRKLVHLLDQAKYNKYQMLVVSLSERSLSDCKAMLKAITEFLPTAKLYYFETNHMKSLTKEKLKLIREDFEFDIISSESLVKTIDFNGSKKVLCTGSQYFFSDFIHTLKSAK